MAQIVIVGARIAGLATAVALQRRGHDVTVIEERTDTATGAGISIWPNAPAALDTSDSVTRYAPPAAPSPRAPCAGVTARGSVTRRQSGS